MIRKYRYLLTAAAAVGAAGLLTFAARNDFGLGRNMEIAVNMMRELSVYYVDEVAKAIAGMQIVKVIFVKNKLINLIVKPQ